MRGALRVLAACVACSVCMTAAGCAARGAPVDAGMEPHQHVAPLPATAGPGYTEADVRFMQDMIGHHAQAITMAELAPTRRAGREVLQLARKIDISQRDEIELMKQWLTARRQAVPDSAHAHALQMPGMLSAAELARLRAARGREFERLFLTYMIRHHEGALQMVQALFDSPGAAQDSEIFRFATDVDADQRDEIFVMETLLERLEGTRRETRDE